MAAWRLGVILCGATSPSFGTDAEGHAAARRVGRRRSSCAGRRVPARKPARSWAGNLRLYARLGYRESRRQFTSAAYRLVHLTKDRHASG
jgi:hypothetical protein